MEYINQDRSQNPGQNPRRIKAKGKGQGAHGGDGLLAWLAFVKERKSGTSGFPVRVKGQRYTVSATVDALGNDVFNVTVSISGAGEVCQTYEHLPSTLAIDCLCDFNRRWRNVIDPSEEVEEVEYIENRPKTPKRCLEYKWAPTTSSWTAPTTEQTQQSTYYMTPVPQVIYEPKVEEYRASACIPYYESNEEYAEFTPYCESTEACVICAPCHNSWLRVVPWLVAALVGLYFIFF